MHCHNQINSGDQETMVSTSCPTSQQPELVRYVLDFFNKVENAIFRAIFGTLGSASTRERLRFRVHDVDDNLMLYGQLIKVLGSSLS